MTSPAIDNVPDSAKRTDTLTVFSWAMWDWGSAAFNAVLVTFIFSVYLTDSVGAQIDTARTPAQWPSLSMTIARSQEHTSELQSRFELGCRRLREKPKSQ